MSISRDDLLQPPRASARRLADRLRAERRTLATAESCTGGLVGMLLTELPGSSDYYLGGAVAYANSAKTILLGVSESVLARHGAVSVATAEAMANGARERLGADLAVSITGVAGPGGGSPQRPVGLVYLGLATGAGTTVREMRFHGDRAAIRAAAAEAALRLVLAGLGQPSSSP